MSSRNIRECPAMSGTAWEDKIFPAQCGESREVGEERALSAPGLSALPLSLPSNPPPPPPAEVQR